MNEQKFFLGLDVSTSVVGITILDQNCGIVVMKHVDLGKIKDFWSKVDYIHKQLEELFSEYSIDEIFIEEPANKFSTGMSSSHTIHTLIKFNALVCWKVRLLKKEPHLVTAAHARKTCGIITQRVSKCGISHKEQTASYLMSNDLKNMTWPKTKTGKFPSWMYDEIDSYVIAKFGYLSMIQN